MYPLDHIGIATENLDKAIEEYGKCFGFSLISRAVVPTQNTEIAFVKLPNAKIEFLAPYQSQGPIRKFLDTRGPGLHHLCYRVPELKSELNRFTAMGYTLIDQEPRAGAHGSQIAFLHPRDMGGVLVELLEQE